MARLLIIDDDRDFAQSLKRLLEDRRHVVEYVENASRGLALSRDSFDVVLLDNRMPGMTGIEFLKVLREAENLVPVILMTNRGTSETVIEAINLGEFDYIEKPLELAPLIDELEPLLLKALELAPGQPSHPAAQRRLESDVGQQQTDAGSLQADWPNRQNRSFPPIGPTCLCCFRI